MPIIDEKLIKPKFKKPNLNKPNLKDPKLSKFRSWGDNVLDELLDKPEKETEEPRTNLGQQPDSNEVATRYQRDSKRDKPASEPVQNWTSTDLNQSKQQRYTNVDDIVMCNIGKGNAQLVFFWLCRFKNSKTNLCCPSINTLVKYSKISKSTIIRTIKHLESLGIIEIIKSSGSHNYYKINRCHPDTGVTQTPVSHRHRCHPDTSATKPAAVSISGYRCHPDTGVTLTPVSHRHPNNSSSNINNNTTTTTRAAAVINFEYLKSEHGFTDNHIEQLLNFQHVTADTLQLGLDYFAFDLKYNNKIKAIKKTPIDLFIGIYMNGGIYTKPTGYESDADRALRLCVEEKREAEEKRKKLERELLDLAFNAWFDTLTKEEKRTYLPEKMRGNVRIENNTMLEQKAKEHFKNNVYKQ